MSDGFRDKKSTMEKSSRDSQDYAWLALPHKFGTQAAVQQLRRPTLHLSLKLDVEKCGRLVVKIAHVVRVSDSDLQDQLEPDRFFWLQLQEKRRMRIANRSHSCQCETECMHRGPRAAPLANRKPAAGQYLLQAPRDPGAEEYLLCR